MGMALLCRKKLWNAPFCMGSRISVPLCLVMLYAGKGIVAMNGFQAFDLRAEPEHARMLQKSGADIAGYIFNKHGI